MFSVYQHDRATSLRDCSNRLGRSFNAPPVHKSKTAAKTKAFDETDLSRGSEESDNGEELTVELTN
jgi:hypothetical protein